MTVVCLGEGILTWDSVERRSNRYGAVQLGRRFVVAPVQQGTPTSLGSFLADQPPNTLLLTATDVPPRRELEVDDFIQFPDEAPYGAEGQLMAVVVRARFSSHIGDLALGIKPVRPEVGERISLGEGRLFREAPGDRVGVRPKHRRRQWIYTEGPGVPPGAGLQPPYMDVRALYRAHEQTVRLEFEPGWAQP